MRKNRRIVLGIKEEEMLLGLACVFLKHGAEPEELELISDPAFLENKQDIDWLIADESCAEGIWPVTGKAFVIGDRTEKNPDIMYLRKGLTAEELYQEMVTKLTVRGMSEDDMQDESRSFDFEMDDIPEEISGPDCIFRTVRSEAAVKRLVRWLFADILHCRENGFFI